MGWKQWSAVAAVIGAGILLQIPGSDDMSMDTEVVQGGEMPAGMATAQGTFRTVALDVTGMT
jgi:hypothetical protein